MSHIKIGPYEKEARRLVLEGLPFDIYVDTHEGQGIEYTISGESTDLEHISIDCPPGFDALYFNGDKLEPPDRAARTYLGNTTAPQAHIRVPKRTRIEILHPRGETTIGDTDGDLYIELYDVAAVTAGRVANAALFTKGIGEIIITEVRGDLSIFGDDIAAQGVHISSLWTRAASQSLLSPSQSS